MEGRGIRLRARPPGRPLTVAVLGGGMGGLACAHELSREGVRVTIYEGSDGLGGKARSQYVPATGTEGRQDWPGEHGFRFYPAFYRHVIASMREIHDPESPTGTVAGNLVAAANAGVAIPGRGIVTTPRKPRSLSDLRQAVAGIREVGGSPRELARYLGVHLKYLTSCDARRDGEIEAQPWAGFIGADRGKYGAAFREVLLACTRTMVAMDAHRGSSRTVGRASSLLLADSFGDNEVDRTMMGPTTDCWLAPWQRQLRAWGVDVRFGHRVTGLDLDGRRIARAWVSDATGHRTAVEADAFVLAVPLDVAHRLITPQLADADPSLERLAGCLPDQMTDWMAGAQFFLDRDVPLCDGHLIFLGSPWALTAISQAQFWNRGARGMHRYGDGRLRGIVSVDVSSCFTPDADGKRLVDGRSRAEILDRILNQLVGGLDPATGRALRSAVIGAHLDTELRVGPDGVSNAARLLVHPPGSWQVRPEAVLTLPNLFLAADYVRTAVDLASMEGANEAGRRAARGALESMGLDGSGVKLFSYAPLERHRLLRHIDGWLHGGNLPHLMDLPGHVRRGLATALGRDLARTGGRADGP